MAKVTKLGKICIDGLNELADQAFAGVTLLSRRPSTPTFWFYTLAIDGNAHTWGPSLRELLSEESLALLELIDVGDFEKARDYCWCCDEALPLVALHTLRPAVRAPEPCYACAFGVHERCSRPGGCVSYGEIHHPETIIDPRLSRAAA